MNSETFQKLFGKKKSAKSKTFLEDEFALQLARANIGFEREVTCIPGRKFRFDFRIENSTVLVEIQGGIWSKGKMGHNSGSGVERDMEKCNTAQLEGFCALSFSEGMVRDGSALKAVLRALEARNKDYKNGKHR